MITNGMSTIDYYDSYSIVIDTEDSIQEIVDKAQALPKWVSIAMRIRHYLIAKPFGLTSGDYEDPPHNADIAPVIEKNENEIVQGEDDKHLYFRLSFLKKKTEQGTEVHLNTVVTFHNIWGKIYFIPVKIAHRFVVKSVLKKLLV